MNNRIRMAKVMFPEYKFGENVAGDEIMWQEREDGAVYDSSVYPVPDPENDANDCEALIRWLNRRGYGLTIEAWPDGHSIGMYNACDKRRRFCRPLDCLVILRLLETIKT